MLLCDVLDSTQQIIMPFSLRYNDDENDDAKKVVEMSKRNSFQTKKKIMLGKLFWKLLFN